MIPSDEFTFASQSKGIQFTTPTACHILFMLPAIIWNGSDGGVLTIL